MAARLTTRLDGDLGQFQQRVKRRRNTYKARNGRHIFAVDFRPFPYTRFPVYPRHVPERLWLHALLASLVPLSLWLSTYDAPLLNWENRPAVKSPLEFLLSEPVVPLGPVALEQDVYDGEAPVPNSAFAEIIALPEVQAVLIADQVLGPLTLPATVQVEGATLRNGPGAEYDKIGELAAGAPIILLAQAGDWFAARLMSGERVWIAAELVKDAPVAQGILDEATDIPPPPPPKVATVRAERLNLRDGPGTQYVRMTKLPAGTVIDLLSRYADWFEVRLPDGQIGWVTSEYLDIAPGVVERIEVLTSVPDPNPPLVAQVDVRINLRGGPGVDYARQGVAEPGTVFDLLGQHANWLKVRTPQGAVVWVSNEVLRVSPYLLRRVPAEQHIPARPRPLAPPAPVVTQAVPPANPPLGASARFSDQRPVNVLPASQAGSVVAYAMQFIGTPYVWGGASPRGFDCSGFTQYVYAQFGLHLPHSAAAQFSTRYGAVVSDIGSLAPGDLVFFVNTYKPGISHVGIYAGGGQVVQALAPGAGLNVASIYEPYWHSRYYGAIRPGL